MQVRISYLSYYMCVCVCCKLSFSVLKIFFSRQLSIFHSLACWRFFLSFLQIIKLVLLTFTSYILFCLAFCWSFFSSLVILYLCYKSFYWRWHPKASCDSASVCAFMDWESRNSIIVGSNANIIFQEVQNHRSGKWISGSIDNLLLWQGECVRWCTCWKGTLSLMYVRTARIWVLTID